MSFEKRFIFVRNCRSPRFLNAITFLNFRFIDSLPDLEELESKLNAYYALEKDKKR